MIAFEIEVTLAATLVTALITILQIMALRREKLKNNREILELEKSLNSDETDFKQLTKHTKQTALMTGKFLAQLIFGIIVFAGLTWWTLCLLKAGLTVWAMPTAIFALIGIAMPFTIWQEHKQRNTTISRLIHKLESREKTSAKQDEALITEVEPLVVAETAEAEELIVETELFAEAVTETVVPATTEIVIVEKQKIPQDSILRRHFLSHLRSQIESVIGPRPTDSILKRHYDTLVNSEMEKYVDGPIEPVLVTESACTSIIAPTAKIEPVIETSAIVEDEYELLVETELFAEAVTETVIPATTETVIAEKQKIPEDSILRRHFLSHLRAQIESVIGPRPADSILKRHYDSLVSSDMEKYVDGPIEPVLVIESACVSVIAPAAKIESVIETSALVEDELLVETELFAEAVIETVIPAMTEAVIEVKQRLPEDSILRRHFLSHIRSQIDAGFAPRPTDSILKRHYDSLIVTEMEKQLELIAI